MRLFAQGIAIAAIFASTFVIASGCADRKPPGKSGENTAKNGHKHDHPHEGPHEGALAEWGNEEYHAEFTVDHEKKQATVYILDGEVKKAAPIPVESITLTLTNVKPTVQITLKADPDKGDPKGSSSRFVGVHETLGVEMDFKGQISAKFGDRPPYSGDFDEKAHDHKHDKKK
ncbi:MAG: hypothetical protein HY040_18935 [Planctomycetes bacterium]|nr:hypothetical protein [Planctomycetota bacterium]